MFREKPIFLLAVGPEPFGPVVGVVGEIDDGLVDAIEDAGGQVRTGTAEAVVADAPDVVVAVGEPATLAVARQHPSMPVVPVDAGRGLRSVPGDAAVEAAASIVAKVRRDALIDALDPEYAEYGPIGSGYPSDPQTRSFLRAYVDETGELPPCARASWSTSEDVLAAAEQSALSEF